jgi:LPS sulfotransferase NodH
MRQRDFLICVPLCASVQPHDILTLALLAQAIEKSGRTACLYPYIPGADGNAAQSVDVGSWSPQNEAQQGLRDAIERAKQVFGIKTMCDLPLKNLDSCYFVYPEAELENPLGARHVVRYFLNRDGLATQGENVRVGADDFIVARSQHAHPAVQHVSLLNYLNPLFNRTGTVTAEQRPLDITYIGQGAQFGFEEPLPETIEITREWLNNDEQLSALLRNCRFFYTADALSPLNLMALACGAIPAFLDNIGPFTDADIDGSELAAFPRLHSGSNVGAHFFPEFETARTTWLACLDEHISRQDANVAQMIDRIDAHFGARRPSGDHAEIPLPMTAFPTETEFGELVDSYWFYPYPWTVRLNNNNGVAIVQQKVTPPLSLPPQGKSGFVLRNLIDQPVAVENITLSPTQLALVAHAGESMAARTRVVAQGTYCVAARFSPITWNGDIFVSVIANGHSIWRQQITPENIGGLYVGYLNLPANSTIDLVLNVQSPTRELRDAVGLKFALFECDAKTGVLGARRDDNCSDVDRAEVMRWLSGAHFPAHRIGTVEAASVSLQQRTEAFCKHFMHDEKYFESQFDRPPHEVVRAAVEQRGSKPTIRYAICMTPRSGSTLLTEILSATGKLGYPLEYLQADLIRWLSLTFSDIYPSLDDTLIQGFKSENGVFGVEVQGLDLQYSLGRSLFADLSAWRMIYLKRFNLLAQAISHARVYASMVWHNFINKTQSDRQEKTLDRQTIINSLNMLLIQEKTFEQIFQTHGIKPLVLTYEELTAAPIAEAGRIAKYVGVPDVDFSRVDIGATRIQPTRTNVNSQYELRTITTGGAFNGYNLHQVTADRYVAVLAGINTDLLSLDSVEERAPVLFVASNEAALRNRLVDYIERQSMLADTAHQAGKS